MKSVFIVLFLFWGLNICQSQTILQKQENDSATYTLCVSFIESINFSRSSNNLVRIKLNQKGIQETKHVNFHNYNYFMIDSCSFRARVLPCGATSIPQTIRVSVKNNTIIHEESVFLNLFPLKEKDRRKYGRELRALRRTLK